MNKLALVLFFASAAFAQEATRTFKLSNATSAVGLLELTATIRTVAQIQQLSTDNAPPTLTVAGTGDQIAMAEWLVPKLDVAAGANTAAQQYAVAGNADDLVLVYPLVHTASSTGVQEIVTTIRTVANIQKIYPVTGPKILSIRGSASQIALAKFLFSELDLPAQSRPSATVHEYQVLPDGTDTVVVYGLAHAANSMNIQVIITTLRTVLDIQNIYQVTTPKLLAIRYTARRVGAGLDPGMLPIAIWLVGELDRETANSSGNQMRMPGGSDDLVQVFYLTHIADLPGINALLSNIRATASIMKAYMNMTPPALVLRGTADRLTMAGQLIEASDRPPAR
jgi:hypothetical protein